MFIWFTRGSRRKAGAASVAMREDEGLRNEKVGSVRDMQATVEDEEEDVKDIV